MPVIPEPLGGALTTLLIGLLLGLDRERAQKGHPVVFAGIRTFPLLALCGYLGALGAQHGFPLLLPVVLLVLVALGVVLGVMTLAMAAVR
jgi:MgtC family